MPISDEGGNEGTVQGGYSAPLNQLAGGAVAGIPNPVVAPAPTAGMGLTLESSGGLPTSIPGVAASGSFLFTSMAGGTLVVGSNTYLSLLYVPTTVAPTTFRLYVGVSSGNIDVGIYDSAFELIWSRGSFSCPAAGNADVLISAGTPETLLLGGGVYYLALSCNNATATFGYYSSAGFDGLAYTKAGAPPLANPLTSPSTTTAILSLALLS